MKHFLVCIAIGWRSFETNKQIHYGPKKGDIVTFRNKTMLDGSRYISLMEFRYDDWFAADQFREVDSSFGQYCEDVYLSIAQFEEAMKERVI